MAKVLSGVKSQENSATAKGKMGGGKLKAPLQTDTPSPFESSMLNKLVYQPAGNSEHEYEENGDNSQSIHHLVSNLLDGDSDTEVKEPSDIMKRIEEECKAEAERDTQMLAERIKEEIRQTIGLDEVEELENESKMDGQHKNKNNFMYVKKDKSTEYMKSLSEESDDQ